MKDVSINRLDSPARCCVMHTREARCHAGRGRGRAPRAHTDPVRGGSASPLKEGSAPNPDPSRLSLSSCRGLLPPNDLSGVVATRRSSIPLDPTPSSLPARALEQSHAARPGNAAGATEAPETQPVAFEISFKPKPRRGPHNAPRRRHMTALPNGFRAGAAKLSGSLTVTHARRPSAWVSFCVEQVTIGGRGT